MIRRWRVGDHDDRGSAAIEMCFLTIVFFFFVGAAVVVGQFNSAQARAQTAAQLAARDISRARNPAAAVARAEEHAREMLDVGSNPLCSSLDFTPDFTVSPTTGEYERITITVTCEVNLSDAILVDLPGDLPAEGEAAEVFDPYRERET
jgi:putative Flp pilus-assembly TadE/G-like protein